MALLYSDLKDDTGWRVRQVDAERVGGTRRQVAGGHVEDPLVTGEAEGNVRDIIEPAFVDVVNRTPHRAQHSQRGTGGREDCRRAGDGISVRIAYPELHWDRAAALAREHATAVAVDWLQNDAARCRPTAGPIRNLQRPVDQGGKVVVACAKRFLGRGDRVSPGVDRCGRRTGKARVSGNAAGRKGLTKLESAERRR